MSELSIWDQNGQASRFAVVSDDLLRGGKRAVLRSYRETNTSDPGRIRNVSWEIWGPIGASKQSVSGTLATDYVQNLDTRFPRRLISAGARNAVTLTGKDPVGVAGSLKLGQFKLGDVTNKLGGTLSTSENVTHFDEQEGRLYAHRGKLSTQVLISTWTVEATAVHPETVKGAVSWHGKGRIGLGTAAKMRSRTGATSTGATYEETQTVIGEDVFAGALAIGSDRCWFVTKNPAGSYENMTSYTLDGFETIANPFQIGDARVPANGLGPLGPFMFQGKHSNIYSFTDEGKSVPLSRSLIGHLSANNGSQFADPGWGWNYAITDIGLRALTSHIDNPVGPGERMREFNGHNGRPTALWAERGELFVVYQTTAGDLYAYRAVFGAETAQTGQPDFYPWWYRASTTCAAIFSTNTPTNTAVVWGEGTNMAYETISRDGRDDLFTSRVYKTDGGVWYGTELDTQPHLLKVLRLARVSAKSLTSGSSWQLAFSFDGAAYLNIGSAVTANGFQTIRPVSAGVPISNISGRAMKPRWTQVAAGSGANTTPPELAGTLEIEYDERPVSVLEVAVTLELTGNERSKLGTIALLESYKGTSTTGPLRIRLPDEAADRYGMVANVTNRRDIQPDGVEAIDVILQCWDVS